MTDSPSGTRSYQIMTLEGTYCVATTFGGRASLPCDCPVERRVPNWSG